LGPGEGEDRLDHEVPLPRRCGFSDRHVEVLTPLLPPGFPGCAQARESCLARMRLCPRAQTQAGFVGGRYIETRFEFSFRRPPIMQREIRACVAIFRRALPPFVPMLQREITPLI
jgi:hypothetical protein